MAVRAPSLTIAAEFREGGSRLTVTSYHGEKLEVVGTLNKAGLTEQRKALRADLGFFKENIGDSLENPKWGDISEAVSILHTRGQRLAYELFRGELWRVQELCRVAMPLWYMHEMPVSLVEVSSVLEDLIPIELLPLFDLSDPPEIADIRGLAEVMRRFFGFSTIIKRTLTNYGLSTTDAVLENVPKLPLKLFVRADLPGAKQELSFFRRCGEHIDLEGPWPDREMTEKQFIQDFAEHLWNSSRRFDGSDWEPLDQVHHFSCHCDTSEELSENHFIQLGHCEGVKWNVTIGDLHSRFAHLQGGNARRQGRPFPLIFLNACGSSVIDPTRIASFPSLFLQNPNNGFIGTESNIPDAFAASFSEQFYTALLRGNPLGDAVYQAKWRMLERHRNPLGILYTVYADPDMHVRRGIATAPF